MRLQDKYADIERKETYFFPNYYSLHPRFRQCPSLAILNYEFRPEIKALTRPSIHNQAILVP